MHRGKKSLFDPFVGTGEYDSWQRRFDEPIPLPDGRGLKTLPRRRALHHGAVRSGAAKAEVRAGDRILLTTAENGGTS